MINAIICWILVSSTQKVIYFRSRPLQDRLRIVTRAPFLLNLLRDGSVKERSCENLSSGYYLYYGALQQSFVWPISEKHNHGVIEVFMEEPRRLLPPDYAEKG